MSASFVTPLTVRFQHCDPAGIVFFPRYYEMLNLAVERFFEERLGASFAALHLRHRLGVPTVRIETEFRAVSRLEDRLTFALAVERVGRSSLQLGIVCRCGEELRLRTTHTLVAVDLDTTRAVAWPEAVGTRLRRLVAEEA